MNNTEKLKRLAALSKRGWSEETRKKVENSFKKSNNSQTDIETWFEKWRQEYCSEAFEREELYDGKIMYKLTDGCVFDRSHKDASVIIRTDGSICYNCFHDSCSDKHWKDFREVYEPNAYVKNTAWQ